MANPSRNGRTSNTRSVAQKLIFGAAFSAIVVFSIFWLGQGQPASALVGDIAGHGFTAEGTIVGNGVSVNRVDLPPDARLRAGPTILTAPGQPGSIEQGRKDQRGYELVLQPPAPGRAIEFAVSFEVKPR